MEGTDRPERRPWLYRPRAIRMLVWALAAACVLLVAADAVYDKHPDFAVEEWFGFYALFGFVMSAVLVVGARWLRAIVSRHEDYYDR